MFPKIKKTNIYSIDVFTILKIMNRPDFNNPGSDPFRNTGDGGFTGKHWVGRLFLRHLHFVSFS